MTHYKIVLLLFPFNIDGKMGKSIVCTMNWTLSVYLAHIKRLAKIKFVTISFFSVLALGTEKSRSSYHVSFLVLNDQSLLARMFD